jgi:hypothetical protein
VPKLKVSLKREKGVQMKSETASLTKVQNEMETLRLLLKEPVLAAGK